jgi:hypothetical protein
MIDQLVAIRNDINNSFELILTAHAATIAIYKNELGGVEQPKYPA